jgi:hypothetical protein
MKNVLILCFILLNFFALSNCASNPNDHHVPDLQQQRELPSGGYDAALSAARM